MIPPRAYDATLAQDRHDDALLDMRIRRDQWRAAMWVLVFLLTLALSEIAHCHGWIDWSL